MGNAYSFTNSKGQVYYLNSMEVNLKNGRKQQIYFFSRNVRAKTSVDELPSGWEVMETVKTKMPVLKKSK